MLEIKILKIVRGESVLIPYVFGVRLLIFMFLCKITKIFNSLLTKESLYIKIYYICISVSTRGGHYGKRK